MHAHSGKFEIPPRSHVHSLRTLTKVNQHKYRKGEVLIKGNEEMGNGEMDWKWFLNLSTLNQLKRAVDMSSTRSWHPLELSCVEMLHSPV